MHSLQHAQSTSESGVTFLFAPAQLQNVGR